MMNIVNVPAVTQVEKTAYVLALPFTFHGDRLMLIRKERPKWQHGRLNGIGGKIEAGELPTDAMVREAKEETGVVTTVEDWKHFATLEGPDWRVYCYSCFRDSIVNAMRTNEEELVVATNPRDLPESVLWNIRWLVPLAMDTDTKKVLRVEYV